MQTKQFTIGLFDDEDVLKSGIKSMQAAGKNIYDVYTPYPVHGLENIINIPRSRLPIVAFCFGCVGFSLAMLMMWYMNIYDWPMDVGGKPNDMPMVTFVPILFEVTVLLASFGMGFTFFTVNKLIPGSTPRIMDERATDDRFVVAIETTGIANDEISSLFQKSGAVEVKVVEKDADKF